MCIVVVDVFASYEIYDSTAVESVKPKKNEKGKGGYENELWFWVEDVRQLGRVLGHNINFERVILKKNIIIT